LKAFVTGANGFLGSSLVRRLLDEGADVTGLVRPTSDRSFLDGVPLRLQSGDINDPECLARGMAGAEVVYHVAGLASDWAPLATFRRVNVDGVRNVMAAAVRAGVRRVLHVSTTAVHGLAGFTDRVETDPMPKTRFPYVETKREGELIAMATEGVEVVAVRPGNIFGPRDRITMLPMLKMMESGLMGVIGGGRALTCPTYIENLVDLIQLAVASPAAAGRAYLATDGLRITWREYLDTLASAMDLPPPKLSIPKGIASCAAALFEAVYRGFGIRSAPHLTHYRVANGGNDYHFSIDRARRELGFEPRVGIQEACRRTADWYLGLK
jgi:nucleoside-diphosphate-sugar epimerase